jgi:Fic family protein
MKDDLKQKIDTMLEEISKHRPLSPEQVKQLKEYYRIGLTYSSNAIEGNTLTEIETKVVIEDGITIGGKPLKDHLEAIGHSKAYDHIYELTKNVDITEEDILKLHHLFYSPIDTDNAGKYRDVQVYISGTEFLSPSPVDVPVLMKKFVSEIPTKQSSLHPVDFASWLHLEFVTIHPFLDGNGRCARLLTNLALLKEGYPIVIIPPIMRKDYMEALTIAQLKKKTDPFYNLIAEMTVESLKDYKRLLRI